MHRCGHKLHEHRAGYLSYSLTVFKLYVELFTNYLSHDGRQGKSWSHCNDIPQEEQAQRWHRKRLHFFMRIQPYCVDPIPDQTSNSVGHKDSQQFLEGSWYIWCQIIMVSPVTNGVGGEIDETLPSKLESHEEFEWVEKHAFESFSCSYPYAAFGLVRILHDGFVNNYVGGGDQEASNYTGEGFGDEEFGFWLFLSGLCHSS